MPGWYRVAALATGTKLGEDALRLEMAHKDPGRRREYNRK
jgi:hypothetical protein